MTFGEGVRALMEERDISLRQLAAMAHCNPGYLSRVIRDLKTPSDQMVQALDRALDAGGELATLTAPRQPPQVQAGSSVDDGTRSLTRWIEAMERRTLLMLAGLGAIPWPVAENLRSALSRLAGADQVDDWRATIADYAAAMPTTPAAAILPELLTDLNEVNTLIEAGHPKRTPLLEVAAALACFTSMATYDAGQPSRAFRWWRTAQQLADESGHAPLRAYIRSRRGADLLYGRKQAAQALELADEAIRLTDNQPSIGLAEAHALRAAALADQGNPQTKIALDDMSRTAELISDKTELFAPYGFGEQRILGTQTAAAVKLGDGKAALRYGQAHLQAHPGPWSPWTQMYVAIALAQIGKADDAIDHAVAILTGLHGADDRLSVRHTGFDVLAALPDQARALPAAQDLRALAAGPRN
jgi:transcriptional regulator with XRE-family HTH domain